MQECGEISRNFSLQFILGIVKWILPIDCMAQKCYTDIQEIQKMDYTNTPTFREVRRLETAYADVCAKRTAAYDNYQQYVDKFYARQITRDILEEAYALGTQYDNQAAQLYAELNQAKVLHLEYMESQEEDCDCNPNHTCNACSQRAHNSEIEY